MTKSVRNLLFTISNLQQTPQSDSRYTEMSEIKTMYFQKKVSHSMESNQEAFGKDLNWKSAYLAETTWSFI